MKRGLVAFCLILSLSGAAWSAGSVCPLLLDNPAPSAPKLRSRAYLAELEAWVAEGLKRYDRDFETKRSLKKRESETPSLIQKIIGDLDFEVASILKFADREHLILIATNLDYAKAVKRIADREYKKIDSVSSSHYEIDRLQVDARIILSRIPLEGIEPGEVLTEQQLHEQAKIAGMRLRNYPVLYRFDTRSPKEIFSRPTRGMWPNPKFPVRSLIEHSLSGSAGSGNFVSTTTQPGNLLGIIDPLMPTAFPTPMSRRQKEQILNDLKQKQKFLLYSGVTQKFREVSIPLHKQDFGDKKPIYQDIVSEPQIFQTFEYQLRQINGVDTKAYGVASEKEIVTTGVATENIVAVRRVIFAVMGTYNRDPIYAIDYGPWERP